MLRRLRHPNVVGFLGVCITGNLRLQLCAGLLRGLHCLPECSSVGALTHGWRRAARCSSMHATAFVLAVTGLITWQGLLAGDK